MDTELKKMYVETGEVMPSVSSAVVAEGDVIVPDVKPDVRKIMSVDAFAAVKKCEVSGNLLKVSGTVFVNILYLPEGEEADAKINSINTRFDFSENLQLGAADNVKATAEAMVRHIDFSLINSRKLNLKIYVGINGSGHTKKTIEFLENPEDEKKLEIKKKKLSLYSVIYNEAKEILVSENIDVPQNKADIGEILKVEIMPMSGECKPMTDKVLVKGILATDMLYISADSDEEPEVISAEIPFSDVFDAEGVNENSHCRVSFAVKDYYFNIKNDINDNPRIVALEALIDVNICAYEIVNSEITEDCYFPGKNSRAVKKQISAFEMRNEESGRINIREKISGNLGAVSEVYSCSVKPVISEQYVDANGVTVKGIAVSNIIAKTENDVLMFEARETPFEYKTEAKGIEGTPVLECKASILSKNSNISAGEAEIFAVIGIDSKILCPISFEAAEDCVVEENTEDLPPAMLVIYFVQNGDTMWEIAKRYKTTPDKIYSANNMEENDKICAGMKLLIPTV